MKKTIFLLSALALTAVVSCKKKDKEDPTPEEKTSEYYFTGTKGGSAFSYKDGVDKYEKSNSYFGSEMVSGSDTTFYQTLTAGVQYFSFDTPSEDKPYFELVRDYDQVGINNATNLAQAFPIGTHNISSETYGLNWFKTSDGISIGTGDYYTKELGTVTFTEVTYLGIDDWFDERVKNYKVKGSIDTYIYNSADAQDSVKVVADFVLEFQSQSFE